MRARSMTVFVVVLAMATACNGGAKHPAAHSSFSSPTIVSETSVPAIPRSTPTSAAAKTQAAVGPLEVTVPHGWRTSDLSFDHACIEPTAKRPSAMGCAGLDIWYGWDSYLPGEEMGTFDRAHPGWYHATDVQPCPVDPTKGKDGLNGIREGAASPEALRPVGDRTAYFYQWQASCDSGYRFSPRAWYLPVSKVLIFDYIGYADADALVLAATFESGRWTFGFFDGAAGTTQLNFDEAVWLGGEAANDYARKHGMESPVPNDYLIVDPDPSTVRVALASNARVTSEFLLAGTEPGKPIVVSVAKLLSFLKDKNHWSTPFHVHFDAHGTVDQIVEQFRP